MNYDRRACSPPPVSPPCAGAPRSLIHVPPVILGDYDDDGDVDPADLSLFESCATGPGVGPAVGNCLPADVDDDGDVDQTDFGIVQPCLRGENQPANPDCASHSASVVGGCLHIRGTALGTSLALRLKPGAPTILEVDVGNDGSADFSFDRGQFNCIVVHAGGGDDLVWIDEINVNSLAGTAVAQVRVDLAGTLGGVSGDGLADVVTVNGTPAPDTISVFPNAGDVVVAGLAAQVQISHSEVANDSLIVNGLGGFDTFTLDPGVAALIMLTLNQ